ncbi:hypothetical protein JQX13_34460 [Archangium violaceum]|jgi:hypothetical protein|uniref:hypothetical protein n=1 Tax=Archangium violaceum TaxID=83451 RepID=UPI00193C5FDA|nr:hypothetical protein [Archangium violaceum]QRK05270.1 hypothetical protein JQX13_34460 [Archangium violaceum]
MAESRAHQRAKFRSAGFGGQVEVPLPSGRRLDALSWNGVWGTEVETSGSFSRLQLAVERLLESGARQRVLKVPERHMRLAAVVLRRMGVSAWVRNMHGSEEFFVGV